MMALPWLKQDVWIPFAASIGIDVDHYLWHAVTHRTLSLRAALRYFGQADPPQLRQQRLLHQPVVLGTLLVVAAWTRFKVTLADSGGFAVSCMSGWYPCDANAPFEANVE